MTSELDEKFIELSKNYNVQGCLILTAEGAVIKTNLDKEQTTHHANVAYEIVQTSRKSVQKDEPGNDIKFFRITTKRVEYLITLDGQFILVVLHKTPDIHSGDNQKTSKRQF